MSGLKFIKEIFLFILSMLYFIIVSIPLCLFVCCVVFFITALKDIKKLFS
jgi:type IV secretory pathway VirB3-like protein